MSVKFQQFETIFKPKSVAIVGASKNSMKMGSIFLDHLKSIGFPQLYPVNPHETEISTLKAYKSVRDIPGQVDYVIVAVPAEKVKEVIEDCVVKEVNAVTVFSSGFSEFSDGGRRREEELVRIAHGKVRIIGPNCLGAFCAESKLNPFLPSLEDGRIGFVCQSGGNVGTVVNLGKRMGFGFSKIVSYCNACDLDSTDFIEYLGEDPKTSVIIAYIEGIKNGEKFLEVTRKVGKDKPIIILRGGVTSGGSKVVASHTGSLAGSSEIWDAVFKYTGAIKVQSIEELLGTALAFLHLPKLGGRKVGIIGMGGGAGVLGVDECEKRDLSVPVLTSETISSLSEIIPPINSNVKNPVDLAEYAMFDPSLLEKTLKIVAPDPKIDVLIMLYHNMSWDLGLLKKVEEIVTNINISKPVVAVLEPGIDLEEIQSKHLEKKIPAYNNLTYACKAIYNVANYYERRG